MNTLIERWDHILQLVKEEHDLTDVSFNAWLKPLVINKVEDQKIYIRCKDYLTKNYVEKKYLLPLQVIIEELTNVKYEIEFVTEDEVDPTFSQVMKKSSPVNETLNEVPDKSGLNPNYTFDTFVVGSNNRFAHSASLAVAESPGTIYNPLFLYGGVGLGKTHLMHSIAHFIQKQNSSMKILYVSSETFTNELIEAIRNSNNTAITKFREKYRNIDVLLIDDIQFIIGKESTQEEFFHTFNELYLTGKQIIISSDKPPKDMETLEERIRSRFECGLTADIGSPDYETRMAILRKKEEVDGFHISDEVLTYIATNIKSNIRELEGALNKLLAFSKLTNSEITMEIAMKELQSIINPDKPKEITLQSIVEIVSDHFQITLDQMMSKNRSNEIAKPRMIAMYLANTMTNSSLQAIGTYLGGRDHSTIIHGINKMKEEYKTNEQTRNQIDVIKKKISPN